MWTVVPCLTGWVLAFPKIYVSQMASEGICDIGDEQDQWRKQNREETI